MNPKKKIAVIDFGGQYNLLIARRVRELGLYCEVYPYDKPLSAFADENLEGIILTGGPDSATADKSKLPDAALFTQARVPVLGICYGMQVMAHLCGGEVGKSEAEFGVATATVCAKHPLFADVDAASTVWMSHNDAVTRLPEGFSALASTDNCKVAAMACDARGLYALQFHPEVNNTQFGNKILENFLYNICHATRNWDAQNLADQYIREIREKVGDTDTVLIALSGGVDSTVCAALAGKAIGDRLKGVFVDHGLMRQDEPEQVMATFAELGVNVVQVDAQDRFLNKLAGVVDPEQKRKIIGHEFIAVFEEQARQLGGANWLLQGTIYPDIIESGSGGQVIKSHHNVGGMPEDIEFKGVIEPLRDLFKDEVRALGLSLGLPPECVYRQPFPGPGLGIRVMGDITRDKLAIVRQSDAILRAEVAAAGLERDIWQYFTVLTGARTVGVKGDCRSYDNCIALRAVQTCDAMTVDAAELPYWLLKKVASRIINETPHVNRVVYDITSKPPGTIEWE